MCSLASVIPMAESSTPLDKNLVSPTLLPDAFLSSAEVSRVKGFRLPAYAELPQMYLYRDQVVSYVLQQIQPLVSPSGDPWLTPSMINNYVKMRLIPAPVKKQYGPEHLSRLLVICVFKQFLSMTSIGQLLHIQQITYPLDIAYDYVASEVNEAVYRAFSDEDTVAVKQNNASAITRETLLVHAAAEAFASKAYLMAYLRYAGFNEE